MTNQPSLNPDALEAACVLYGEIADCSDPRNCDECKAEITPVIRAYLDVTDPQLFTIEEIEELPVQSVIEDVDGCIFEIIHNGERNRDGTFYREYVMTGDVHSYSIDEIDLPATVLKRAPETPRR